MTWDILSWVCIFAALVTIAMRSRPEMPLSQYRTLSSLFWVFMAGSLACSGIMSETWWKWLWWALAAGAVALAVKPPEVAFRQNA